MIHFPSKDDRDNFHVNMWMHSKPFTGQDVIVIEGNQCSKRTFHRVAVIAKGKQVNYNFSPTNKCLFVFLIDGSILVSSEILEKRDAIGIWDTDQVQIICNQTSHFLIIETPVNQK